MGMQRIDRGPIEVGFKGWDWSMGSIQDPWYAGFHLRAARTRADACEARFLVELYMFVLCELPPSPVHGGLENYAACYHASGNYFTVFEMICFLVL